MWGSVRYLQLGAAFLQGLHRQLEGSAVAADACAHFEDLQLGAAAALWWWGRAWLVAWQSLAQHPHCSCLSPTYQQCAQDGRCLGAVGQPQLAHSGPHLLQEADHGRRLHLGTQHRGTCHLGLGCFRALGDTRLTMECCTSRLWSWGQALASMVRVSGVTPWQSESLRKVSRGQDSLTSCRRQRASRIEGDTGARNQWLVPLSCFSYDLSTLARLT